MTAYQRIYDEAIGNYGLITVGTAREFGIASSTLVKLAHRGRLERIAHGLYRIDKYVPSRDGLDAYACAVAGCGESAYLWGPSVLAIRNLCPTDPARIYVATPRRYRGRARSGIVVKDRTECRQLDNVEGIRVQNVGAAILASLHIVMFDRLLDAVGVATERNLMNVEEARETVKELYKHD